MSMLCCRCWKCKEVTLKVGRSFLRGRRQDKDKVGAWMRFNTPVLSYRAVNGSGPSYTKDMDKPYAPAHPLRSATASQRATWLCPLSMRRVWLQLNKNDCPGFHNGGAHSPKTAETLLISCHRLTDLSENKNNTEQNVLFSIFNYLHQACFWLCFHKYRLLVCLSAGLWQKLLAQFSWNLVEGCSMGQGRTHYTLEGIRIHKLLLTFVILWDRAFGLGRTLHSLSAVLVLLLWNKSSIKWSTWSSPAYYDWVWCICVILAIAGL